ncbi:MAG TPA: 2-oxoacid:acceptor oxidoreductase family protein, partial [Dissulfurispiraceae bacterium]
GQGVLFITRLLAESAIGKGLPVLASETHGMAQRGGTVLSHLKAGGFSSPLIRPACADGLILLKEENLVQHRFYLKKGGWIVMNAKAAAPDLGGAVDASIHLVDADTLSEQLGNYQSLNLIVLGFAAARLAAADSGFFCAPGDITALLQMKFAKREGLLKSALQAFDTGAECGGKE